MFFQVNITSFDNTKSLRTKIKQHPQEGHKSAKGTDPKVSLNVLYTGTENGSKEYSSKILSKN